MPLFECSQCHVVDNTALTEFWWEVMREGNPALCSQCDPSIGKWHDHFPRTNIQDYKRQFGDKSVQYDAAAIAKVLASQPKRDIESAVPEESET